MHSLAALLERVVEEAHGDEYRLWVETIQGKRDMMSDGRVKAVGDLREQAKEEGYPCADCGMMRTKAEGGTTFTVCDDCWDKHFRREGSKP